MNLFDTQERLNALPPSQQTLQYLSAAAEGQNPNVPPWLALVRMTEIQKEMQSAQQMQQSPQGEQPQAPTVKDKVQQASGIMTLQQQQQQAAMQQMAQQAAQGQPQQAPAGIAAVAPQAFRHGGGVRHFEYGGGVDPSQIDFNEIIRKQEEEARRARELADQRHREALELARRPAPIPEDPSVIQRREEQAMGVDPRRAFDEQQRRAQELQQRLQQEQATREQERGRMGQQNLFSSMIAAREGTRGARGSGLAGLMSGFGQSYMSGDQAIMAERRKSEDAMMKRQAEIDALLGGVDTARMGAAGDAAKQAYGYSKTKAEAEGVPMKREFDIGRDAMNDAANMAQSRRGTAGDVLGRAVSAAGTANTARIQGIASIRGALTAELTPVQRGIAQLSKDIENTTKDAGLTTDAKNSKLAQLQQQQAELRTRESKLLEELRKLQASISAGGAPSGVSAPVGASGSSAPTGGTMDPRLNAARFRQDFPPTR